MEQLLSTASANNYQHLHNRITAANGYFSKCLDETLDTIKQHTRDVGDHKKVRKYMKALKELSLLPQRKKSELHQAVLITEGLMKGEKAMDLLDQVNDHKKSTQEKSEEPVAVVVNKPAKGETFRISLQLFKEGNSIAEIAKKRGLALSTVEGHLAKFLSTGEIEIGEIVPHQKIKVILEILDDMESPAAGLVKEKLGENYSYGEIRAVMNYRETIPVIKQANAE
jgi:hypothetical protein